MPPSSSLLQTHIDAFLLAVASSTDNFMVGFSVGLSSSLSSSSSFSSRQSAVSHFTKVNLVVALCNASGTLIATYGGDTFLRTLPQQALQKLAAAVSTSSSPESYVLNYSIESLIAGLAFVYLAWKEYWDNDNNEQDGNVQAGNHHDAEEDPNEKQKKRQKYHISYSIALPMTLNNLAGGVAGGVMGLTVLQATFYAFVISVTSMALGHWLAGRIVMLHGRTTLSDLQQQQQSQTNSESAAFQRWCKYVAIMIYVLLAFQSLSQV